MTPSFLQIHTLTSYAATLLNRDDTGRAKRLPFGGCERIRISSQCLKSHWRKATGNGTFDDLDVSRSVRSRRVFSDLIAGQLAELGMSDETIVAVLKPIAAAVIKQADKGTDKADKANKNKGPQPADLKQLRTEQILVMGEAEIQYLTDVAAKLADPDPAKAKANVSEYFANRDHHDNLRYLTLAAGLEGALFGRMITSDIMARTDAAIHVAHAFTVHEEETEPDYFSAVDDILEARGDSATGHINTSELSSGLFYGYTAVDMRQLTDNLSGDTDLAGKVVDRLVKMTATVSPGAKRGGTAPYSFAEFMAIEAGSRQPRSLANAFAKPVRKRDSRPLAVQAVNSYLELHEGMYGAHEERKHASMIDEPCPKAGDRIPLAELAAWAASQVSTREEG